MTRPIAFRTLRPSQPARRGGFTLVELLVVIAIIAMLMGLLIPAVQRAREAGRRAQCMNNQQQIGKAFVNYATAKDRLPSGFSPHPAQSNICLGWVVPMLPYIEQNALYQTIQGSPAWVNVQVTALQPEVSTLVCPSRNPPDTIYAPLSYVVNAGMPDKYPATSTIPLDWQANGVFFDNFSPVQVTPNWSRVTTDLAYITKHDGNSLTVMFSENIDAQDWLGTAYSPIGNHPLPGNTWWQGIIWYVDAAAAPSNPAWNLPTFLNRPYSNLSLDDFQLAKPSSNHPGGFLMTMCDAHTVFVSEDIEYRVYAMVMAPDSGKAGVPGSTASPPASPYPVAPTVPTQGAWQFPNPPAGPGGLAPVTEADLTR